MVRSSAAAVPLYRSADVALAVAVLTFLAPLLVLAFALLLVVRDSSGRPRGSFAAVIDGFLHRSGLGDLPFLFDVLTGRASLFSKIASATAGSRDVAALAAPPFAKDGSDMPSEEPDWAASPGSRVEMVGRYLRASFAAPSSSEFEDLLCAIDLKR